MSTIAVLGMPNTGKSTLFNRLTGSHAQIGNWPGLTVDLMQADLELDGQTLKLVDLPGLYDLRGHSDDEAVVRRFLERTPVDLVLVVLNASQLDRQLRLALQVQRLGLPAVVALNMADEARRFGVVIDEAALEAELGLPVVLLSAKYGRGVAVLQQALRKALVARTGFQTTAGEGETAIRDLEERLAAIDPDLEPAQAALVQATVRLPPRAKRLRVPSSCSCAWATTTTCATWSTGPTARSLVPMPWASALGGIASALVIALMPSNRRARAAVRCALRCGIGAMNAPTTRSSNRLPTC